jgi:hypothetical protein
MSRNFFSKFWHCNTDCSISSPSLRFDIYLMACTNTDQYTVVLLYGIYVSWWYEKCLQTFGRKTLMEKHCLEDKRRWQNNIKYQNNIWNWIRWSLNKGPLRALVKRERSCHCLKMRETYLPKPPPALDVFAFSLCLSCSMSVRNEQ